VSEREKSKSSKHREVESERVRARERESETPRETGRCTERDVRIFGPHTHTHTHTHTHECTAHNAFMSEMFRLTIQADLR
jgi:hypothetical protein